MTKEDLDKIVQLIEQRKIEILEANNVTEGEIQYTWIDGIYNDISGYLQAQLTL